ncbi:MAG: InlB B-repeat-containing protein, partial [Dehalococcoidia bacterium]|nr:InlB B-repeat-containing protein [Dehalococcoidia bacterium]
MLNVSIVQKVWKPVVALVLLCAIAAGGLWAGLTPTSTTVAAAVDTDITINFPGVTGVTVQYHTNNTGWVTVATGQDDTYTFTFPAAHQATFSVNSFRVVKGAMTYTFTLTQAELETRTAHLLDVPINQITVTGMGFNCILSLVKELPNSGWVYQNDHAAGGGTHSFNVFDNDISYELQLTNPGFHVIKIDGVKAGDYVDISEYFYTVTIPSAYSSVRMRSLSPPITIYGGAFFANPANAGSTVNLLKTGMQAEAIIVCQGQTYTKTFFLDGFNPFVAYIVEFESNGGTQLSSQTVYEFDLIDRPSNPSRTGYNFDEWYTDDETFVSPWDFNNDRIIENIVLYAKWAPNIYTVTFNPTGGTVSPTSKLVTYDSRYGELPTPIRAGYTFNGWHAARNGGGRIAPYTTVRTASNHILYARWTANTYTVTFNPTGGTVVPTSKLVTYDRSYGELPIPTRSGYIFDGWY